MAVTKIDPHDTWPMEAAEDLSAHQFYVVKITSEEKIALIKTAGEAGFVLQDAPKEGEKGTIALPGPIVKGVAGGAISAGDHLTASAEGKLIKAETGNEIIGTALASGASGDIVTFTSNPSGAKA